MQLNITPNTNQVEGLKPGQLEWQHCVSLAWHCTQTW